MFDYRMQTQINHLRRKVNQQKPETKHYYGSFNAPCAVLATSRADHDVTTTFRNEDCKNFYCFLVDMPLFDRLRNIVLLFWRNCSICWFFVEIQLCMEAVDVLRTNN